MQTHYTIVQIEQVNVISIIKKYSTPVIPPIENMIRQASFNSFLRQDSP